MFGGLFSSGSSGGGGGFGGFGSLFGGSASLLGGIAGSAIGGVVSAKSAAKQREFNEREAQKDRDWQTAQYKARYQDTMADMRAAGLNPLLAYRQGTGGGVPSGAQASASLGQEGAIAAAGAAKGVELALSIATKKKIEQDTATSAAQQSKLVMDAAKVEKETVLLSKDEPWALIMEQVAKEGVKPLLDYLLETYGTAKKRSNTNGLWDMINPGKDKQLSPALKNYKMRWPNESRK